MLLQPLTRKCFQQNCGGGALLPTPVHSPESQKNLVDFATKMLFPQTRFCEENAAFVVNLN
jgi:hypothetical protein